jgi:CRP-like cAMP-binding protein
MFQLAEDERRLHSWVVALGRGDAAERIAAMLLDLRLRLRRIGLEPRKSFSFPLTQRDIADHLGITVVHTNRVVKRLRQEGLLVLSRGSAIIQDLAGLEAIARPMLDIFEREVVETRSMAE